ncbi:cupin domain-containing protein [Aminobacterium sp. MB27-C1]|uniref:cupin domain-containing protein n=1 Tax=Aminobacterium sp. MB27-C1 TaxID=3070661 RepID=UPI001BCC01E0|nr:cupin domain-containing protein [Aminobacterium sp. MB27-C1]WMI71164.1 cupin domain-containing protein [Aminobacterium sp. MB27-C1]
MKNLFDKKNIDWSKEISEILAAGSNVRVERIVSTGQSSPKDFWYDQEEFEWVCVIQGEGIIDWADGARRTLKVGDWVLISPHEKHRVSSTTKEPPCIWLAFFWKE